MYNRRFFYNLLYYASRFQRGKCRYSRYGYWRHFNWRSWFKWKPPFVLALSAGFSFQEKGLSDDLMRKERDSTFNNDVKEEWEVLVKEKDLTVVKRERGDTGLNEYCCSGCYRDISAQDFIDAQMDLQYRQKWDAHVIKLEVLDEDEKTESQVVRWIAKYPYPLYPREYIYVRRMHVDDDKQCVTIVSCCLGEDTYPSSNEYVRVSDYHSVMVVKAHSSFEEKGFDYVLSYYDNPEGNIPSYAYNWIVNSGGPTFLTKIYSAAKELENSGLKSPLQSFRKKEKVRKQQMAEESAQEKEQKPEIIIEPGVVQIFESSQYSEKRANPERMWDAVENVMVRSVAVLEEGGGHWLPEVQASGADQQDKAAEELQGVTEFPRSPNESQTTKDDNSYTQLGEGIDTVQETKPKAPLDSATLPSLRNKPDIFNDDICLASSRFRFFRKPTLSSVSDLLKLAE